MAWNRAPYPAWGGYAASVLLVVLAAAIRSALPEERGDWPSFAAFYPAVMLAAALGGLLPGLLATLLSVLFACLRPGPDGFGLAFPGPADWPALGVFLASGSMMSVIAMALHRAMARAAEVEKRNLSKAGRGAVALRRNEERFRAFFDHAAVGIALALLDGRFSLVNDKFCEMLGYSREELENRSIDDITFPGDPVVDIAYLQGHLPDKAKSITLEKRYIRKDGGVMWISLATSIIRDEEGRPVRVLGFVQDITSRKRLEEELTKARDIAEERARALDATIESVVDGFMYYDRDLRLLRINSVARSIVGLTGDAADNLVERSIKRLRLLSPDGRLLPPDRMPVVRAARGETVRNEAFRIRVPGRDIPLYISLSAATIRTPDGRALGVVVTFADVTGRKLLEDELRQAKDAAEAASRAKSEFLANMSHEIRTPMNGIMGMTELALASDLPSRAREYLLMVKQSASHLMSIINDILDLSKIEAGRLELDIREFDLRRAVDAVGKPLAVLAEGKGIAFSFSVEEEVPDRLVGDPGRLKQVLTNVVGNAIKFTRKGRVTVDARRAGEPDLPGGSLRILFTVKDTGIGIPADRLDTIFDSFTQGGASAHAEFGGTGLGLSISRQLVEMMGGCIWAESVDGVGSIFRFTVVFGIAAGEKPAEIQAGKAETERLARGLKVLVAEDNPVNRVLTVDLLRMRGHRVETAANGEEALAKLSRERFDLVLMDIRMPKLDGIEAVRRLRAGEVAGADPRTPVVALTAYALAGDRERLLDAGMDDYVSKPVSPEELDRVLAKVAA